MIADTSANCVRAKFLQRAKAFSLNNANCEKKICRPVYRKNFKTIASEIKKMAIAIFLFVNDSGCERQLRSSEVFAEGESIFFEQCQL